VIETAGRHRAPTRCVWLDTPLAQAQVNLVERMLDRFGSLPTPEELAQLARREPGVLAPTSQMRALRALEPPSLDEGFSSIEQMPSAARPRGLCRCRGAEASRLERALAPGDRGAPHLVFEWSPDGVVDDLDDVIALLAAKVSRPSTAAARRAAGAGRRCLDCRWPSLARTASIRRARRSSAQARRIARSRTRSARGMSRFERARN